MIISNWKISSAACDAFLKGQVSFMAQKVFYFLLQNSNEKGVCNFNQKETAHLMRLSEAQVSISLKNLREFELVLPSQLSNGKTATLNSQFIKKEKAGFSSKPDFSAEFLEKEDYSIFLFIIQQIEKKKEGPFFVARVSQASLCEKFKKTKYELLQIILRLEKANCLQKHADCLGTFFLIPDSFFPESTS